MTLRTLNRNCGMQTCNTSILITQSDMKTTMTVHLVAQRLLPQCYSVSPPSMGTGRMGTWVSASNRTITILVPLFPIVPGQVCIAFSTPWGHEYLGSMPIILFLKACEVRVEGKKGSGRYRGRYLLHVCE